MIHSSLPIDGVLPDIVSALRSHSSLLLSAEPGAGKSTVVPLTLHESGLAGGRKILMLEPRVLAARAAAKRMAFLLGEKPGGTVGYRTRLETVCSSSTRIEVLTEAILTRMLQEDPALEDTGIVIFDEFHERSIHADLSLALALDARAAFRDDLKIVVMSATLDADRIGPILGNPPVITSPGRCYPVKTIYSPEHLALPLELRIRNAVTSALRAFPGDALVFLPGEFEIRKAMSALAHDTSVPEMEVLPLFGSMSAAEQDYVFSPHEEHVRRAILATSIAETSITLPFVRIVIDSGLMRAPRFSPATGMNRLETLRVTAASADQRRGRAGRTSEGVCIRLWHEYEQGTLDKYAMPEILSCDLAPAAIELVKWGRTETTARELPWPDPPPAPMLSQAFSLLRELGAIRKDKLSAHGEAMRRFPLHPRLAHAALLGAELGYADLAANLAALLEDRDTTPAGTADASGRLHALSPAAKHSRDRVRALLPKSSSRLELLSPEGILLAAAYPDRIARRKDVLTGEYSLSNGVSAFLSKSDPLLHGPEFLAVAETSTLRGRTTIRLAAGTDPEELEEVFPDLFETKEDIHWNSEREAAETDEIRTLGSLTLSRKPKPRKNDSPALQCVLFKAIRAAGMRAFEPTKSAEAFRARVCFLHNCGEPDYPDLSEPALMETLEIWLAPYAAGAASFAALRKLDYRSIWENLLPRRAAARMGELAPEFLTVPSGSRIRISYTEPNQPAASVRLQELFGMTATPMLAGKVPLLLDILSPAMRTVQKTRDLVSFWNESYYLVRKDMRGRYPKHDWPEDPWKAQAHRGVRKPAP